MVSFFLRLFLLPLGKNLLSGRDPGGGSQSHLPFAKDAVLTIPAEKAGHSGRAEGAGERDVRG